MRPPRKRYVADPCDGGCPGWGINPEEGAVNRCDSCAAFPDDDAAAAYVLRRLMKSNWSQTFADVEAMESDEIIAVTRRRRRAQP